MKVWQWICLVMFGLSLIGCSQNPGDKIEEFAKKVESRPGGNIEPLPRVPPYQPFSYTAFDLRNPFAVPKRSRIPQPGGPDYGRQREALEAFSLEALKMRGVIGIPQDFWALIEDPKGIIHRVKKGNHIGMNFGKIDKVTETEIFLTEKIDDGKGGWKKNPATLSLER